MFGLELSTVKKSNLEYQEKNLSAFGRCVNFDIKIVHILRNKNVIYVACTTLKYDWLTILIGW